MKNIKSSCKRFFVFVKSFHQVKIVESPENNVNEFFIFAPNIFLYKGYNYYFRVQNCSFILAKLGMEPIYIIEIKSE